MERIIGYGCKSFENSNISDLVTLKLSSYVSLSSLFLTLPDHVNKSEQSHSFPSYQNF